MSLADRVPGMVAGSTVRNLVLGIVYFLTMPIWLAFFPFVLGLFVWRNTSGWADGLTALPGVSAGGGLTSGLAAFAYGLVLFAALGAGFGGGGSDDAPDDEAQAATDGGSTPTATAAPEPETTAPETATPPPDTPSNTHAVGESFVVGSGEKSIEYTVIETRTATSVGSDSIGEESDGVFIIVTLSMTNVGNESLDLTSNVFSVIDSQDREFDVDTDALIYLEDAIAFEQLNPGLKSQGVIVFDVAPGEEYQLRIEPAGIFSNAEPHQVELGTVEEE